MDYLYLKALHIIFVVTWFAGLFYIVRLFIYQVEAHEAGGEKSNILVPQFKLMQRRLWYGITWPSAVLTLVLAFWLLSKQWGYLTQGFMHLKLAMVFGLYVYHFSCQYLYNTLAKDNYKYSSLQLRIWNEVATVFLVAIVFIIVLKDSLSWLWGVFGILLFGVLLMLAIRLYKRFRED
jgi:putative membrane protein